LFAISPSVEFTVQPAGRSKIVLDPDVLSATLRGVVVGTGKLIVSLAKGMVDPPIGFISPVPVNVIVAALAMRGLSTGLGFRCAKSWKAPMPDSREGVLEGLCK